MQVLHIVASVSLLFIPFAEADCPSQPLPPIEIPIRNVSLTNSLVRRGVALSVGTAAQPLAFEVSP